MGRPAGEIRFTRLGASARLLESAIVSVEQLGIGRVSWTAAEEALVVQPAVAETASDQTIVFRIICQP
jgi:hypothetical protein